MQCIIRLSSSVLAILFLLFIAVSDTSAQQSIDEYIDEYKNEQGVFALTLPGWLIRKGIDFSDKFEDEDEQHAYDKLIPYLKEVRLLAAEDHVSPRLEGTVSTLVSNMLAQDKYELYASIRDGKEKKDVIVQSDDEIITQVGLIINADDDIFLVRIKADLPIALLEDPAFKFNQ